MLASVDVAAATLAEETWEGNVLILHDEDFD